MKLYTSDRAPNPDRVKFFLKAKGKWDALERVEMSIIDKEHLTPDYRKLSPLAQLPCLELDNGVALTESRAICTYLEGAFPEPNLMGATYEERALIEMWDRRVEMSYLLAIAGWFRHSHPAMAELEVPQCSDWAASSELKARKMASYLDERLGEVSFVAGERFTIADITLFVAFGFGRIVKYAPWDEHANLKAWRERMSEMDCFAR